MVSYANGFSLSVNDSKSEFILSFKQRIPVIGSDGNVSTISENEVASIVLTKDGFEALRMLLNSSASSSDVE